MEIERIIKLEEEFKKEKSSSKRNVILSTLISEYYNLYVKSRNKLFLDKIIDLSKNLPKKDYKSMNVLGLVHLEKEEYDSAINIFKEIINEFKLPEDDKNVILYNLSLAYFNKGDYYVAYETLKDVISNSRGEINVLSKKLLAKVCLKLGAENIKYVEEAKKVLESLDMPSEELAIAYAILFKYYNDFKLLGKAKELANNLGDERVLADVLSVSEQEDDLRKALDIYVKLNDKKGKIRVLYKLSKKYSDLISEIIDGISGLEDSKDKLTILYDLYERTKLVHFLKEAIKCAENINDYLFLARGYAELANYENEVINLRLSIKYYEKYIEANVKK
ncbi:hypothetical protein BFU36_03365 [Sulfolobus sp. A20]|uniref:tetratricopeptide repeat protein n=1 Tax=Sulfolobaceae TaxID=118883 RepID=UPI0008638CE7|nr:MULTISPECIES: CDC27 family protein [unclassified Sulfolobus]AOL15921.1 hypothetical protein BFU36_03365 [Sulfolobus sp. A20]